MFRNSAPAVLLALSLACAGAQAAGAELSIDVSAGGLLPVTWASDGPALAHRGFDALVGLEYDSAISIPFRLEAGYIRASASYISPSGELYRGWEGLRLSFLTGYDIQPYSIGRTGDLQIGILVGGAITAADFSGTALAYAYPSLIAEPRIRMRLGSISHPSSGPWAALPVELMFRAGIYSLTPGLSLGWRQQLEQK